MALNFIPDPTPVFDNGELAIWACGDGDAIVRVGPPDGLGHATVALPRHVLADAARVLAQLAGEAA